MIFILQHSSSLRKNISVGMTILYLDAGRVQRVKAQIDLARECLQDPIIESREKRFGPCWEGGRSSRSVSHRNDGAKRDARKEKNGECDLKRKKAKREKTKRKKELNEDTRKDGEKLRLYMCIPKLLLIFLSLSISFSILSVAEC